MNFRTFGHVGRQIGLLLRSCRRRSFAEDQVGMGGNMLTPLDTVRGSLLLDSWTKRSRALRHHREDPGQLSKILQIDVFKCVYMVLPRKIRVEDVEPVVQEVMFGNRVHLTVTYRRSI